MSPLKLRQIFEEWYEREGGNEAEPKAIAWAAFLAGTKANMVVTEKRPYRTLDRYPFNSMRPGHCWEVPEHISMETARKALSVYRKNCEHTDYMWKVQMKPRKIFCLEKECS